MDDVHFKALSLLRKSRADLDNVLEMLQKNKDCMMVVDKSKAAQESLSQANLILLENHLKNCVSDLEHGKDQNECFEEIMKIFKASGGKV
ncbi:metal-sensing transcriptional repressor [Patescibacteria group bacterium]|nr:metal-sensing transcriptional repressor [Patescibacteria group bacterium]